MIHSIRYHTTAKANIYHPQLQRYLRKAPRQISSIHLLSFTFQHCNQRGKLTAARRVRAVITNIPNTVHKGQYGTVVQVPMVSRLKHCSTLVPTDHFAFCLHRDASRENRNNIYCISLKFFSAKANI